ncbi:MAG: DinB family protein [Lewinellaceae bacterium]|jgi:hypothetical protein|nr:DinB family protein [Lewinellaceae bacterium]
MKKSALIARNQRYAQQVNTLLADMEKYTGEMLNRKPADGGWSAIQTMHHLILTEELSLAYVKKKMSFNPEFGKTGPGALWRGFLLWAYLSTPFKFKAPKTVSDESLPASATLAETRRRWQDARDAWSDFFEQMPEETAALAVYRHPRAGRLGWTQMMSFFETHLGRHEKQIRRALKTG